MVDTGGWIKLYRCLLDKPIWKQATLEQKVILVTLLLMANHAEEEWWWNGQKYKCKPGQFVTSLKSIADKAGKEITVKNVRTALNRFETFGFLANQSAKTGRLITIENWASYQANDSEGGKEGGKGVAKTWQRGGKGVATNKNDKNDKNDKNKYIYSAVTDHLNEVTGQKYKATSKTTKEKINARLAEGFTLEDFITVIDKKTAEWGNDPKMSAYLRPMTLFGTKFESYLNQPSIKGTKTSGQLEEFYDMADEWARGE